MSDSLNRASTAIDTAMAKCGELGRLFAERDAAQARGAGALMDLLEMWFQTTKDGNTPPDDLVGATLALLYIDSRELTEAEKAHALTITPELEEAE